MAIACAMVRTLARPDGSAGRSGGVVEFEVDAVRRHFMHLPLPAMNHVVSRIKVLGRGEVTKALTVHAHKFSGTAAELTHINYAFGNVRNNRCEVGVTQASDPNTGIGGDAFADYTKAFSAAESVDGVADTWNQTLRGNWNQLKKLKAKHAGLKVLISLGGWTWSRGFSEAAKPANRQAFVASCIDAYIRGTGARGAFVGICREIGYPADHEFLQALRAQARRRSPAGAELKAPLRPANDEARDDDSA